MVSIYQWLPNSSQSIGFSSNVELEKGLGLAISLQLNSCSEAGKKVENARREQAFPGEFFAWRQGTEESVSHPQRTQQLDPLLFQCDGLSFYLTLATGSQYFTILLYGENWVMG